MVKVPDNLSAGFLHSYPRIKMKVGFSEDFVAFFVYQVDTLLKGLEKIAASADIPMLVAGDFNSTPGRLVQLNGVTALFTCQ